MEHSFRMDRSERFYKIDHMIRERGVVPVGDFLSELEVSLATFKRDIEYMRSRHYAPIVWDRDQNGYRFEAAQPGSPKYELPGLWFSPREAQALLTMEHLLESLEPTLLGAQVQPLKERLSALLGQGEHSVDEVRRRIRVISLGARRHEPKHFQVVAGAVLGRGMLKLTYWNRSKDEVTEREVSPQRLVHYRNNWYLDAWCHLRKDIRSFALDGMRDVVPVEGKAKEVPDAELDSVLASGYGIFSGASVQWAVLRFTPQRARYVSLEEWHPSQKSRFDKDGSFVLEVPYSSQTELVGDILRWGEEVEVLSPTELRDAVARRARATAKRYD
ncbi:MAG TPA: WYL domain-containing protein [Usitatibacter sp.]|jgi:predicted DNA-binding transcriptional regulator YafY|nr:WYL domain-containing protein [Usitatibacter sp.]